MRTLWILLALVVFACDHHGTDNEPYDSFGDCFDDHHNVEAFPVDEAIQICCLEHPIGGVDADIVCGDTQTECEDYVGAELPDTEATATEITAACAGYLVDHTP